MAGALADRAAIDSSWTGRRLSPQLPPQLPRPALRVARRGLVLGLPAMRRAIDAAHGIPVILPGRDQRTRDAGPGHHSAILQLRRESGLRRSMSATRRPGARHPPWSRVSGAMSYSAGGWDVEPWRAGRRRLSCEMIPPRCSRCRPRARRASFRMDADSLNLADAENSARHIRRTLCSRAAGAAGIHAGARPDRVRPRAVDPPCGDRSDRRRDAAGQGGVPRPAFGRFTSGRRCGGRDCKGSRGSRSGHPDRITGSPDPVIGGPFIRLGGPCGSASVREVSA